MNFPQGGRAILDQMYEQYKDLANGNDDQRRKLTRMIASTFAAKYNDTNWGTKSTTPNHPQSKDSLVYKLPNGNLDIFDWQSGNSRQPILNDGQGPTFANVNHHFIEVEPFDWLSLDELIDNPVIDDPSQDDNSNLEQRIITLEQNVSVLMGKVLQLEQHDIVNIFKSFK